MTNSKPIADLSLDLDNLWAYLRTRGDAAWSEYPSYLPYVVPRILDILDALNLQITFFLVGQDVAREENREAVMAILQKGHEIGNHSFNHHPWLQRYSPDELRDEFERTEAVVRHFSYKPMIGFRAPGYSLTGDVLELLVQRGYEYDASTLPTHLGPLARVYYRCKTSFTREQAEDRKQLFGSFTDGFRRLKPYYWSVGQGEILELPVSTMPIIRIPFHLSYIHYLAQFSSTAARVYFNTALQMCRWTGTSPSLLLHPLDFLGSDEVAEMAFFPGMKATGSVKRRRTKRLLARFADRFEVVPLATRARRLEAFKESLPRVERPPHRTND